MSSENNKAITDLLGKLKGDSKTMLTVLLNEFKELKEEFKKVVTSKDKEISELKSDVNDLKKTVNKLEEFIDDQDAYERRDTIILSGNNLPAVTSGENCTNLVCQVIKDNLRVEIPTTEINTAHRLGRKPTNQGPDKRPLIVKLCRRDTKKMLFQSAKSQNSASPIYLNESLTPKRRTILYALRQMKKFHPTLVTGCTSIDGKIFAFTPTSGPRNLRHLVNTHSALVEFCRQHVKVPLDTFLAQWEH